MAKSFDPRKEFQAVCEHLKIESKKSGGAFLQLIYNIINAESDGSLKE